MSLTALGLAAVDPVGIGVMPVLLTQQRPYRRAYIFLGGSFVSLLIMGVLFARGIGNVVLRFEEHHRWLVPVLEAAGGVSLLIVAAVVFLQARHGGVEATPSGKTRRRLQLGDGYLFAMGAALVAVQSVVDVVFVVAMIQAGRLRLSNIGLLLAAATYAIAALAVQLAIVVAYRLAPARQKEAVLRAVRRLLKRYTSQTVIMVSLALGVGLIILATSR